MREMRENYHGQLDAIVVSLVGLTETVGDAVNRATQALMNADLQLAEQVISDDAVVDAAHDDIEQRAFNLLARQSPVAGELRTIVAALRMTHALGRMGDLAAHIAKVARLRYPTKAVPDPIRPLFAEMARIAEDIVAKAGTTIAAHDADRARELEIDDDAMDAKHRELFRELLSDSWSHGVESAVDVTLLGRYYERFADHAVAVARRVIYLVTGEYDRMASRGPRAELPATAPGE